MPCPSDTRRSHARSRLGCRTPLHKYLGPRSEVIITCEGRARCPHRAARVLTRCNIQRSDIFLGLTIRRGGDTAPYLSRLDRTLLVLGSGYLPGAWDLDLGAFTPVCARESSNSSILRLSSPEMSIATSLTVRPLS